MKRFHFNKLVRDNIVERNEANPDVLYTEYRVLGDDEYRHELKKKIAEEVEEVLHSADSEELVKEIGDLQATVDALRESFAISEQEAKIACQAKASEAGKFLRRHYIDYVDITDDSKWVEIFRAQPEKYKEENV